MPSASVMMGKFGNQQYSQADRLGARQFPKQEAMIRSDYLVREHYHVFEKGDYDAVPTTAAIQEDEHC